MLSGRGCPLRLPPVDEAGVLEVEVLKHVVHPTLLAGSNLARMNIPGKQPCILEEVDDVVVVRVTGSMRARLGTLSHDRPMLRSLW